MSDTKTLWQRCEALGPQSDGHVEIVKRGDRWIIFHDSHPIVFIMDTHDSLQNTPIPQCLGSEWLAICIIHRFEQYARSQTDETDGRHRDPDFKGAVGSPTPLPRPTGDQRRGLHDYLVGLGDGFRGQGFTVELHKDGKAVIRCITGTDAELTQHGPVLDYDFAGTPVFSFWDACKLVEYDPHQMPLPETLAGHGVTYVAEQPTMGFIALSNTEAQQMREFLRMAKQVAPIFEAMSNPIQFPKP
jgi:hypothetical protein